jgi:hypothetical protein
VPWWGAVVIAVTACLIGFAFDAGSGDRELTSVFAALYLIGCVAAVLAVRQSSVFTAVVQPPLILFVAVPGAYFLFHQSEIAGLKDILINCGYPLIERFLLMLTTSVLVLLIGAARWYFGGRGVAEAPQEATEGKPSALSGLKGKLGALVNGTDADDLDDQDDDSDRRPRRHADRPAAAQRRSSASRKAAGSRTGKRPPPSRSRHARPPIDDLDSEPTPPRRRRPTAADPGDEPTPPPRRRPREPREPGARTSSREYRPRDREPRDQDQYERPRRRPNRYESYDPRESFDSYDAPPPRPRRPAAGSGTGSTHHPVSRVRYRDAAGDGDDRVEHRTRPRTTARHSPDSDGWRFDS